MLATTGDGVVRHAEQDERRRRRSTRRRRGGARRRRGPTRSKAMAKDEPARPAPTIADLHDCSCPFQPLAGAVRSLAQRLECTESRRPSPTPASNCARRHQVRRQFVQRHQHEGSFVHAADAAPTISGSSLRFVADEQHVDVEGARPPPHVARRRRCRLGASRALEQLEGPGVGLEFDHHVPEVVLGHAADRLGLVDRRDVGRRRRLDDDVDAAPRGVRRDRRCSSPTRDTRGALRRVRRCSARRPRRRPPRPAVGPCAPRP